MRLQDSVGYCQRYTVYNIAACQIPNKELVLDIHCLLGRTDAVHPAVHNGALSLRSNGPLTHTAQNLPEIIFDN